MGSMGYGLYLTWAVKFIAHLVSGHVWARLGLALHNPRTTERMEFYWVGTIGLLN